MPRGIAIRPLAVIGRIGHLGGMALPTIFFDPNCGTAEGGYPLDYDQSRKDLATLGDALKEGTKVTIVDPDQLEMDATLRSGPSLFDPNETIWFADPLVGTLRYLDGSA